MPEYQDEQGHPRPLPRLAQADGSPSFESLVSSVSKDIRPRVVLDEWLRLGVAHICADGNVWLHTEAFVPEKGFDEKAYYLGNNLHDQIAACTHNLNAEGAPMMERSVYYDELTEQDVAKLAGMVEAAGMEALQKVNRQAMKLQRRSKERPDADHRMNFGVYFYHTPEEASGSAQDKTRSE